MDTVAGTALDKFVHHGIPWMGKKAIEMGRYYGSEALKDPKLQKTAIDYALEKLNPMIQNVGSDAVNKLSTKIRPKKNHKTYRKELAGSGLLDRLLLSGVFRSPFHVDFKKGYILLTDPGLFVPVNKVPVKDAKTLLQYYKDQHKLAKKKMATLNHTIHQRNWMGCWY